MVNEIDFLKIDITLQDICGEEKKFTTLKALTEIIEKENDFWRKSFGSISNQQPMREFLGSINDAKKEIINLKSDLSSGDESTHQKHVAAYLHRVISHVKKIAFSQSPFAVAFLEACKLGHQQGSSFWAFSLNHDNTQLPSTTIASIEGAILGYEFFHQDESVIYKRRDSEKRTLASLRKSLSDKTDELIGETDDFIRSIDDWKATSQGELATDREAYKNEQEEFLSKSEEQLTTQLSQDKTSCEKFFADAKERLVALENLYQEKLRLEPAATYWNTRATKLKNSGRGWGALLIIATVAIGLGFAELFQQWMASGKVIEKFTAMHWQGVVVLVAIITMAIFMIRVLGKLTFSSFHLQRDAEERELLSYLYLALSENGTVDNESRQVVLQSLFSRAETGLLSGDHGPTIPIAEVVQKFKSN